MNQKIRALLNGEVENHILPFFWQHGEEEAVLRRYMQAIHEANCGAVCVESRPHPDFCGEKWWADMDVILDEARNRGMKIWILDDSHFPTGFANGAVKNAPVELHRQGVCVNKANFGAEEAVVTLDLTGMIPPEYKYVNMMEQYVMPSLLKDAPHFEDDQVIAITAVSKSDETVIHLPVPEDGILRWEKPTGEWTVWVIGLSRNCGVHRDYINMLSPESCRLLLDAVYEPHWQHYAADFGNTIAGFFSDEPELGNGHLYHNESFLGTDQDLPFADTMPTELEARLGSGWANHLYLLWDNDAPAEKIAEVRYAYMDALTKLVRKNFSHQIAQWCHDHGVQYIGHVIEDSNAHSRVGPSLGHYFRGLDGQDMSGIDDIGGQVLPQGEVEPKVGNLMMPRDGEFYHYMLGNLAASAAAIEPKKQGRAMCEIFGNYGWKEGLRLEKYLADHFMVRGINHFVPHAFSPKAFPDPDCPPHFYAHGHNPQYRHFGALMGYMNRVSTLISGGHRVAPVAIAYHAEAEWTGKCMLSQKPAKILAEAQIEYDCIPIDVFAEPEHYHTVLGKQLQVNTQTYRALIVPYSQYVTASFAKAVAQLVKHGFQVLFLDGLPEGVCDGGASLLKDLAVCPVVALEDLLNYVQPEAKFVPSNSYLRAMHYQGECEFYYFVNEGDTVYSGQVQMDLNGDCYWYDPWNNRVYPANQVRGCLDIILEPLHSRILVVGEADAALLSAPVICEGQKLELSTWMRSTCAAIDYPKFENTKQVSLPDGLAEEDPVFSGFVRYETCLHLTQTGKLTLEIADAWEGVEVFLNGRSAGIQIVPPFRYDLTDFLKPGENALTIEVATTLERYCYDLNKNDPWAKLRGIPEPTCGSGITGEVSVYLKV